MGIVICICMIVLEVLLGLERVEDLLSLFMMGSLGYRIGLDIVRSFSVSHHR